MQRILRNVALAFVAGGLAFGAAMAQDKKPFDKEEATRNADFLAMLSTVPRQYFGEGTDKGETRAKPEIWAHRADFDGKMEKMVTEAAELPAVARRGGGAARSGSSRRSRSRRPSVRPRCAISRGSSTSTGTPARSAVAARPTVPPTTPASRSRRRR